jgi:hypothetical protein
MKIFGGRSESFRGEVEGGISRGHMHVFNISVCFQDLLHRLAIRRILGGVSRHLLWSE